jgi:hypothetical protein
MGALFTIILVAFIVSQVGSNIIVRCTYGSPAKDGDILELFEKKGDYYNDISKNWDDVLTISSIDWDVEIPKISRINKWFLYYPYYIEGVGVVPRRYKSRKIIDAKFAELFKGSRYDTNKRKKLGLE